MSVVFDLTCASTNCLRIASWPFLFQKNDMEIHALEMEVNDMHGKFIIPKLKKVHNFKLMGGEE